METPTFSMKLLIDTKANKVLFAEAAKEVIDFLFSLLSLPLGCIIKHLTKEKMVGCVGNIYGSVESLNETYVLPNQKKDSLLNPKIAFNVGDVPLLMLNDAVGTAPKYNSCPSSHNNVFSTNYVTDAPWGRSSLFGSSTSMSGGSSSFFGSSMSLGGGSLFGSSMSTQSEFIASGSDKGVSRFKGGFVKEVVTYMVTDDLVVTPISTISSITLLNKFNVANINSLDEKVVDFGTKEGLELLKNSLESKTVLTNVFLANKFS